MPEQHTDLTTPEAVAAGQKFYDRITTGQCNDAVDELNAAYGQKEN